VFVHDLIIEHGAYPSPLNYNGYPKSVCTSVNEVICHGIPDDRPIRDGDIVNLDVTVYLDGVHGDTNATFLVGDVDPESRRLVEVTQGVPRARHRRGGPGPADQRHRAGHRGPRREARLRRGAGFIGHGIGEQFHTDLQILHYYSPDATTVMRPGMTFTIEPMITMGSWRHVLWDDGWTRGHRSDDDGAHRAVRAHAAAGQVSTDDGCRDRASRGGWSRRTHGGRWTAATCGPRPLPGRPAAP
jgi:methionyl aminopeptidase